MRPRHNAGILQSGVIASKGRPLTVARVLRAFPSADVTARSRPFHGRRRFAAATCTHHGAAFHSRYATASWMASSLSHVTETVRTSSCASTALAAGTPPPTTDVAGVGVAPSGTAASAALFSAEPFLGTSQAAISRAYPLLRPPPAGATFGTASELRECAPSACADNPASCRATERSGKDILRVRTGKGIQRAVSSSIRSLSPVLRRSRLCSRGTFCAFSDACRPLSRLSKETDAISPTRQAHLKSSTYTRDLQREVAVSASATPGSLLATCSRGNGFCASATFRFVSVRIYTQNDIQRSDSTYKRPHAHISSVRFRGSLSPSSLSMRPLVSFPLSRFYPEALLLPVPGNAKLTTTSNAASFDIFQRLKDPPEAPQESDADAAATGKKRKPSDRVLRLVDEVMNLTLIEAADLCDLCQEKLAERSGGPTFTAAAAAGRTPFPHPAAMFAGMGMPGVMPAAVPPAAVASATATPQPGLPTTSPGDRGVAESAKKTASKEARATFSIKLTGFDAAKKVAVVKEVRAITAMGLKESKDLVEQAPKIVKKGVPAAEAEVLKKKLEAAGAQVTLE